MLNCSVECFQTARAKNMKIKQSWLWINLCLKLIFNSPAKNTLFLFPFSSSRRSAAARWHQHNPPQALPPAAEPAADLPAAHGVLGGCDRTPPAAGGQRQQSAPSTSPPPPADAHSLCHFRLLDDGRHPAADRTRRPDHDSGGRRRWGHLPGAGRNRRGFLQAGNVPPAGRRRWSRQGHVRLPTEPQRGPAGG